MRFDRNNPGYKPCPPAAMRRMQNNPLETKRPHRDKVGTKAAVAVKKAAQGAYYRHLSGKRLQVKIHRGSLRPYVLPSHHPVNHPSKHALKEFGDGIYLSDWTGWFRIYFVRRTG